MIVQEITMVRPDKTYYKNVENFLTQNKKKRKKKKGKKNVKKKKPAKRALS